MHESVKVFRWGWALAVLGLTAACNSNGTIKGTITVTGASDNSAEVAIPGTSIQVGADGTFTFNNIPQGSITVYATRPNYTPASQTVTVTAGKTTDVAFTLNRAPVAPQIVGINAAPSVVPPGGTVTLTAVAASLDGYPLNYTWTAPAGWTASGPSNQSTLVLTAPAQFSQSALVTLTVDDGQKASSNASAVVATSADMAPTAAIIATPTNPYVGVSVGLTAQASATDNQTVTYSWSLIEAPQGSTATLASSSEVMTSFTPDVAGTYMAQLIVTDENKVPSTPATATLTVAYGPPSAPLSVDVSATPSTVVPGGNVVLSANAKSILPVTYSWTVPSGWTAVGATNQSTLLLTAPLIVNAAAAVTVAISDSAGATATGSAIVQTASDSPVSVSLNATPASVPPGGTTLIVAAATDTDSAGLTYTWTVPTGWTGSSTSNTLSLTAPMQVGTQGAVQVTVTDALGNTATGLTVVTTQGNSPITVNASANPGTVAPGGTTLLIARATDANASATLSYSWTLPTGWTASGAMSSSTLAVTAPVTYGAQGAVQVTVTDGLGGTNAAIVGVATQNDSPPQVNNIGALPGALSVGSSVSLTANVSSTNSQAVTYAWLFAQQPATSKATISGATTALPTFIPDVPGAYLVQLIVTDTAGLSSLPARQWVNASPLPPTAVIAGTAPLQATVNNALLLDGSGSTGAPGHILTYSWNVAAWPTGSHCGGNACLGLQGSGSTAKLTPDVGGSYSVVLTVADPQENMSSVATTTVTALGLNGLSVSPSSSGQTVTVHQALAQPIVVQAIASDGKTPLPNMPLTWFVAGGSFVSSPPATTNSTGSATAIVQAGRVAGAGYIKVYPTSQPSLVATIPFTAVADQPVAYAVSLSGGTADSPAALTIKAVDAWGNLSTLNAQANSASLALSLNSPSNNATYGSATTGSITLGSPPTTATVTLSNGQFAGIVVDPTAETIFLNVTRTTGSSGETPLPIQSWSTIFWDGAEKGTSDWIMNSQNGALGVWGDESTVVKDGADAFGVQFDIADESASQEADMQQNSPLSGSAGSIMLLGFWSNVQAPVVSDTVNNCTAETNFRVGMTNGPTTTYIAPQAGYEQINNCMAAPSFGSTQGWVWQSVDITDAFKSGLASIKFQGVNAPDANAPATASSGWAVDDVVVRTLGPASLNGTTATATILAGAPTQFVVDPINQSAQLVLNSCFSGSQYMSVGQSWTPPIVVNVQLLDDHGNAAPGNPTVEVDWSGASGTVTPALPLASGTAVDVLPSGLQIQLNQATGSAQFTVIDSANGDSLSFKPSVLSNTSLTAGSAQSVTSVILHCHTNGVGNCFSIPSFQQGCFADTAPAGTYNQTEALNACMTQYGQGRCSTNADYAYETNGNSCGGGSSYGWVYNAFTPTTSSVCSSGAMISSSQVGAFTTFNNTNCGCSDNPGQINNINFNAASNWQ